MTEQLVYDEVTKMWMTQASLDELKKKQEAIKKEEK